MSTFTTPRARKASISGTPTTTRTASSNAPASPHYVTTRRHSLYGTEDRVIIDPGSRVWKIGFSGEARPRAVFRVQGRDGAPLWSLSSSTTNQDEEEEEQKVLYNILQQELRKVFHKYSSLSLSCAAK
jgi:actin-related protein 10